MSAKQNFRYERISSIVIVWILLGLFITLYDFLLLLSRLSEGPQEEYSLLVSLFFNLVAAFLGSLFGGIALERINRINRSRPYGYSLILVAAFFVMIVSFLTLLISCIAALFVFEHPFSDPGVLDFIFSFILDTFHLKNILFWALVVIITQFAIQVSDKFGPGNLWRIITGQYYKPKKEERIFMFLDLKSSTTIAEQLGEERYHEFLKNVFADITDPIINCKAEIYQYVGDEVVINWKMDKIADYTICLECFFEIRKELEHRKAQYLSKFDTLPQFKAGAHCGNVIVGEIGIIKRDITYSGDVLNTCARIQGQCNAQQAQFLISDTLKNYLKPNLEKYTLESKGAIILKGKGEEVELISVELVS